MKEPDKGIPEIIETTFTNGNKLRLVPHCGKWIIVHGEAMLHDGEKAYMATTLSSHDDFKEALHDYCKRLEKSFTDLVTAV